MSVKPKVTKGKAGEEENDFAKLFKSEVRIWLDPKVRLLITDYLAIKNSYHEFAVFGLSDYSYLITPAFKALEGTLIQLGEKLKFDMKSYNFKIGVVFSDDNLENFYNDVLTKIGDLDKEQKEDVQMWLNDARRILRHFRHSPAHFLGESKTNWDEAFSAGDHILRVINEMCFSIIKSNIIKNINPEHKVKKVLNTTLP